MNSKKASLRIKENRNSSGFLSVHYNIKPVTAHTKDTKLHTYDIDYLIKQLLASRRFEQLAEKLADKTVKKFKDETNILNNEKKTVAIPRSIGKTNDTVLKTSLKYIDLIKAYRPAKEILINNHQNIEVTKDYNNNRLNNETKSKHTKNHKIKRDKSKKISILLDKTTIKHTESTTNTDHTTTPVKVTIMDKSNGLTKELKEYIEYTDKENGDDNNSEQEISQLSTENETTTKKLKTTVKKQHKNQKQTTHKETSVIRDKAAQKPNETNKITPKPAVTADDNESFSQEESVKSSIQADIVQRYSINDTQSEETNTEVGDVEPSEMQPENEEIVHSNEKNVMGSIDYNSQQEAQSEKAKPLIRREGDKLFTFVEAPEYADYFAKLSNATDYREIVYDLNENSNITVTV